MMAKTEAEFREEFITRAKNVHQGMLNAANTEEQSPDFDSSVHRYYTFKAMAVKEAADKVIEEFEKVPMGDSFASTRTFKLAVMSLISPAEATISFYKENPETANVIEQIADAKAMFAGYYLVHSFIYNPCWGDSFLYTRIESVES